MFSYFQFTFQNLFLCLVLLYSNHWYANDTQVGLETAPLNADRSSHFSDLPDRFLDVESQQMSNSSVYNIMGA